ncbi:hypothetical protein KJ865_16985, partial [Myxococcota bacterium]|nr:hypothetical protein [Myxococcota bacterium]
MNNSIILTIVFASLVFSCEAGKGMHSKKYIPSAQKTKSATDMGSKKKVTAVAVIRSKAPTTPLTTPTPGPPAGDSFTLKHVMDDLNASLGAMSKAEQKRTVCQLGKEYLHRLENPAGPGLTREQRTQIEKLLYRINRLRRKLSEFGVNNENRADRDFERDRRREYISAHLYHIKRSVELI